MHTVRLGKGSMECSRLAYGCCRIAGSDNPDEVHAGRQKSGRQAVIAAYEAGFTLFDLADVYGAGLSESIFGQVLKEVSGMRDQVVIATKCGVRWAGDPDDKAPYRYDGSASFILRSCEQSLKRLGVETIDLYQLHRPDFLGDPDEIAAAFSQLRQSGKVRQFGVSNFAPSQWTTLRAATSVPLVTNQIECSLNRIAPLTDGTLDQCLREHITPLAWSPLGGGQLATNDPIDMRMPDHAYRLKIRETLDLIAREREVSRPVVALAWLLKHPARIIPIIGSTNPDHIADTVQAVGLELSREEWYRLMEAVSDQRLP